MGTKDRVKVMITGFAMATIIIGAVFAVMPPVIVLSLIHISEPTRPY